ncbi:phosphodiester glycosidase family protein [Massilia sp. CCM 8734]|uniref:phosphodiester glycosidase family protein n=1 Tax=Massilia sp. CCM 8734 TaxID=2609283 RepID=UPI001422BE2A|nr:phosphodiester glycosidase family protein [Massilia sp. CCM 8734]NIA00888.1 hypothetical protein [Massilia sp. CCM 8734]
MRVYLLAPIAAIMFNSSAKADSFPFNPIPLPDYIAKNQDREIGRLKISVASATTTNTPELRIGGIVICSKTSCYRPNITTTSTSRITVNGTANLIVDSSISHSNIEKIFFENIKGGNVAGSISLSRPLNIEKGFYGGEIFVTLKPTGIGKNQFFGPSNATSNLLRENGRSIYYNPAFAATVNLDFGVNFKLPAGALSEPEIFNIQVNDTGDQFPSIDIYPYVTLKKQASISARRIERLTKKSTQPQVLTLPSPGTESESKKAEISPASVDKAISKTEYIKSSFFEELNVTVVRTPNVGVTAAGITTTCSAHLSHPTNMKIIKDAMASATSGIVHLPWCKELKPSVHIALINLTHPRIKYKIPYNVIRNPNTNYNHYELRRLSTVLPVGGVAINGFMWEGDEGTGPNQGGYPKGFLVSEGIELANNVPGGGFRVYADDTNDGNKLVMAHFANLAENPGFAEAYKSNFTYLYARTVVSSSTSVLKNGNVCSGDTTTSRWSAVGAGPGFMMLVSSTSDGETSASELCSLFTIFGANGALRLDGGPSAAMIVDNIHVNPLKGLYSFKYGTSRYIPYGLHFSW